MKKIWLKIWQTLKILALSLVGAFILVCFLIILNEPSSTEIAKESNNHDEKSEPANLDALEVKNVNSQPLENEKVQAETQDKKKTEDEICRKDITCWAETKFFSASSACQKQIERLAQYDFEWTDGMLEPKFSHYRWHNISNGSVTYIGDKFKAQNGFGAWSNVIYECDYDLVNEAVLDVRAEQGRL